MADSLRKSIAVSTIAILTIASGAPTAEAGGRRGRAPVVMSPSIGVGTGIGFGPGATGVRTGGILGPSADPVLNSATTGALLGAAGGPIGMAVGAGVGLLHGLWAKKRYEEQARAEEERQRAMDRELERQMAAQRPGGPALDDEEGQGVLMVADHLAGDAPSASPRMAEVDGDGFRPVYEGERLLRREHRTPEGRVDVVLHYDTRGRIVRREESSRLDGRLDTSMSYVDGIPQRKDSDTDGDGKPDVWAFYAGDGELARLESVIDGGRRRTAYYVAGAVVRDEELDGDGSLNAVAHYEQGRLVRREVYTIDESAFTRVPVVGGSAASGAAGGR
jgi:hypothetical protein